MYIKYIVMTRINDKKFVWTLFAGIAVIVGMLIKNGYESQFKLKLPFIQNTNTYKLGPVLCAFGMLIAALSVATNPRSSGILDLQLDGHGALAMLAVGMIIMFGMKLREYQSCDDATDSRCPQYIIAGFSGGWGLMALALSAQSKFAWLNTLLAFGAALLIMTAKLGVLPYQRRTRQTDGPGYAMITAGWFALALANGL
jgi:uncharacterized membrane protein YidH (DUF202 family)